MGVMACLRRAWWLCAILLAPVLTFAVAATSYHALRCSMTGGLVATSCCPEPTTAPDDAPPHSSLADAPCCEPTLISTGKIPTLATDGAPAHVLSKAVSLSVAAMPLPTPRSPAPFRPDARGEGPPRRGSTPPYVLRHAFLI